MSPTNELALRVIFAIAAAAVGAFIFWVVTNLIIAAGMSLQVFTVTVGAFICAEAFWKGGDQ